MKSMDDAWKSRCHYLGWFKNIFFRSINETKSAFTLNYEMLWEDDSEESIQWVQEEFDFSGITNMQWIYVILLFLILIKRMVMPLKDWREAISSSIVAVEEPVYRREFGLWEHQKYFVELAFREHKPGLDTTSCRYGWSR